MNTNTAIPADSRPATSLDTGLDMVVAELDGSGGGRLLVDDIPVSTIDEAGPAQARQTARTSASSLFPTGCRLHLSEPGHDPQTEHVTPTTDTTDTSDTSDTVRAAGTRASPTAAPAAAAPAAGESPPANGHAPANGHVPANGHTPHHDRAQPDSPPQPEPQPDLRPEPESDVLPRPNPEQHPTPQPTPQSIPQHNPLSHPQPNPQSDPQSGPEPGLQPEPDSPPGPGRLNLSDVSRQQKAGSRKWWRRMLGLGPADDETAHDQRLTILNRQFAATQVVMMTSIKGGSPKTSTTVQTAHALAENSGHQVVVLSADPANGNTGERMIDFPDDDALLEFPTAIDLYRAEIRARHDGAIGLTDAHEIDQYLGHAGRARVCVAQQLVDDTSDDSADIGLTADQITVLLECLSRVATIILVDCGTNPCTGAHKTLLSRADAVVIAAIPRFDVLKKGEQSLDFIAGRRPDGLSKAVLAVSHTDQGRPATRVDPDKAVAYLSSRVGGGQVSIPYDPHIAGGTAIRWPGLAEPNRQAAVTLAAAIVDLFPTTPQPACR